MYARDVRHIIALLALLAFNAHAASLKWDRILEDSLSERPVGYYAYVGKASRQYEQFHDVTTNTSWGIEEYDVPGTRMYLAATAYVFDGSALESDFSDEVTYDPPTLIHVDASPDLTNWVELTNFVFVATNGSAYVRTRVTSVPVPPPAAPPMAMSAQPKVGKLTAMPAPAPAVKPMPISIAPPTPRARPVPVLKPKPVIKPKPTKGKPK